MKFVERYVIALYVCVFVYLYVIFFNNSTGKQVFFLYLYVYGDISEMMFDSNNNKKKSMFLMSNYI